MKRRFRFGEYEHQGRFGLFKKMRRLNRGGGFRSRPIQMFPIGVRARRYRGGGANAKATRALNLIRKFKKEEEVKDITLPAQNNTLGAITPEYTSLNLSQIGNTSTTRIGNKITAQSITIRGIARLADNETVGATCRLVLVWDRKPAGAMPTWNNIFTANLPFAIYNINPQFSGRFQVLWDETYDLNLEGQSQTSFNVFVPLKGKKVAYNGNAGTVADLQKGHLLLTMISSDNNQPLQVKWESRFRFTDA